MLDDENEMCGKVGIAAVVAAYYFAISSHFTLVHSYSHSHSYAVCRWVNYKDCTYLRDATRRAS